jgi:hypothetical protein
MLVSTAVVCRAGCTYGGLASGKVQSSFFAGRAAAMSMQKLRTANANGQQSAVTSMLLFALHRLLSLSLCLLLRAMALSDVKSYRPNAIACKYTVNCMNINDLSTAQLSLLA